MAMPQEVAGDLVTVPGLWSRQLRATTLGLVLTVTLVASEALAVITILPVISHDLGGIDLYGWVISAFSLGMLFGIVVGGTEADRRGPALPFLGGLLLFAVGLALGGLAPTMLVLVLARGLQGVGAGIIDSVAFVSIGRSYDDSLRARVLAILATAWIVPGLVGPSVAAFVALQLGWRWVFLGLVPVVAGAGAIAIPPLLRLGPPARVTGAPNRAVDAMRVALGTGLVLAGLGVRFPLIAIGLVVAGVLVGARPLLRLLPTGTLRAVPGLPAAILARGLLTFAFYGADTFVPLLLTSTRGQSPVLAGIAVTAATLAWTAGAWFQARMAATWPSRRLVTAGLFLLVLGIAVVAAVLLPAVPVWVAVLGWLVGGLGIGIAYGSISLAVMREAAEGQEGSSAASMQLSETLGIAFGAGLGGVAVAAAAAAGWEPQVGLGVAFALAAAAGGVGVVAARRLTDAPSPPARET
jgi:MFS family permease